MGHAPGDPEKAKTATTKKAPTITNAQGKEHQGLEDPKRGGLLDIGGRLREDISTLK